MLSYHNDPTLKEQVVQTAREHQAADRYIRGTYWNDRLQKGCAVGCTLRSLGCSDPGLHEAYERLLGIPTGIAYLQDKLFERSKKSFAMAWPLRFFEAIPIGRDLSLVEPELIYWMLGELPSWGTSEMDTRTLSFIEEVRDLYGLWLSGYKPLKTEWQRIPLGDHFSYGGLVAANAAFGAYISYSNSGTIDAAAQVDVDDDELINTVKIELIAEKLLELLQTA